MNKEILSSSHTYNIHQYLIVSLILGLPGSTVIKNLPAYEGDQRHGSDPWVRRTPEVGHGSSL